MTKYSEPTFQQADWEIVSNEPVYQGFFELRRLELKHRCFEGGWTPVLSRELFERGQAVAVLLYDPALDSVVLCEQFRVGAIHEPNGPWLIELVAGVLDVAGEAVTDAAERECQEEAGCSVSKLYPVCRYLVSPGACTEVVHLYIGIVDASTVAGVHGVADEHEDIRVFTCAREQAISMVNSGRINNGSTIIALQWLQLNYRTLE